MQTHCPAPLLWQKETATFLWGLVPCPFFSTIVLFKNRSLFPTGFWNGVLERRTPMGSSHGAYSLRGICSKPGAPQGKWPSKEPHGCGSKTSWGKPRVLVCSIYLLVPCWSHFFEPQPHPPQVKECGYGANAKTRCRRRGNLACAE